jgi:UDP-3-O-[3-hydroxymyristoyl] N-acetylglucosamine deacetylase
VTFISSNARSGFRALSGQAVALIEKFVPNVDSRGSNGAHELSHLEIVFVLYRDSFWSRRQPLTYGFSDEGDISWDFSGVQYKSVSSLQHTLAGSVSCSGVGLHSGKAVSLTLKPAVADHGIVFVRVDANAFASRIPALASKVTTTQLGTTIANSAGMAVATIEHLMAALYGMGIDNAVVEIDGPEVPILDGSSEPFIHMIDTVGLRALNAPRRVLEVIKPVEVRAGNKVARLEPSSGFDLDVTVEFKSQAIGRQRFVGTCTPKTFANDICGARTFGFADQVEALQAQGLALGGSLDNAIVIDGDEVVNSDAIRFDDEFARHKALDAIGDLALAGAPLKARYVAELSGHELNVALVRALLADTSAWRWSFVPLTVDMLPAAGA